MLTMKTKEELIKQSRKKRTTKIFGQYMNHKKRQYRGGSKRR
jgi:hypothetical protein